MDLASRIDEIIRPTVEDMGYDLVRVQIKGADRLQVQIMAERSDGTGMDVESCAQLSRSVSALLDVEDPITKTYTLEVSSPGIDRPLMKPQDFERLSVSMHGSRPSDPWMGGADSRVLSRA